MQIKPLHQLTQAEITALAHAAAEREESVENANVFEPGTPNHRIFSLAYNERRLALGEPA